MSATRALKIALWPFERLGTLVYHTGRLFWYILIVSNPLTLGIWLMTHVDRQDDEEEEE